MWRLEAPTTSCTVNNPHITFDSPKIQWSFSIDRGLVPGPPWIPKFTDVQILYISLNVLPFVLSSFWIICLQDKPSPFLEYPSTWDCICPTSHFFRISKSIKLIPTSKQWVYLLTYGKCLKQVVLMASFAGTVTWVSAPINENHLKMTPK